VQYNRLRMPETQTLPARSNGKHPGGRPTKRTPEIVDRIAEAISYGLTNEDAACLVGINDETLERWFKLSEFCGIVKRAVVERKLIRLKRIDSGAEGWQGTAWTMERQYPREWSRPELQINQQFNIVNARIEEAVPELELIRMLQIRGEIETEVAA
jgi:hypothetical protein